MRRRWWTPGLVLAGVFFGLVALAVGASYFLATPTTTTDTSKSVPLNGVTPPAAAPTPAPAPAAQVAATPDSGDLCKDIPGLQTAADIVANKLVRQNDGTCVPSSTLASTTPPVLADQCLDIPGLQTVVPDKMRRDAAGNCAVPPPEEAGVQGSGGETADSSFYNLLMKIVNNPLFPMGAILLVVLLLIRLIWATIRRPDPIVGGPVVAPVTPPVTPVVAPVVARPIALRVDPLMTWVLLILAVLGLFWLINHPDAWENIPTWLVQVVAAAVIGVLVLNFLGTWPAAIAALLVLVALGWPAITGYFSWSTRLVNAECTGPVGGNGNVVISVNWWEVNPNEECRVITDFPPGVIEFCDRIGAYIAAAYSPRAAIAIRSATGAEIHGHVSLCAKGYGDPILNPDCSIRH
jgi:hypothetical protein